MEQTRSHHYISYFYLLPFKESDVKNGGIEIDELKTENFES